MIRVAHRTVALHGEVANGDGVFARVDPDGGRALFAVIDGLGHGPHAAAATAAAREQLESEPLDGSAEAILRRMHDKLRGTRGAAATVCVIVARYALSICGVGNVALRNSGSAIPFVLSPGILGSRVSRFREARAELRPGDRLVLHSDGVGSSFSLEAVSHFDAEAACEAIFARHRKTTDDATVLVADLVR